jgi:L(+)-tartrate dehydratase beta subunit
VSIFGKEYRFTTPLTEQDVRQLNSGDILYISGEIWAGREVFIKRYVEDNDPLPGDVTNLNVLYTGNEGMRPLDKEHKFWKPQPLGATLGLRFEKWIPELMRKASLRALITKGNMGPGTRHACKELGCVQLTPLGWTVTPHFTDVLERMVKDEEIYWREAGMVEALILYHVKDSGPWIVNMDTQGNVLYENIYSDVDNRIKEIYAEIGIPENFEYTNLEQ